MNAPLRHLTAVALGGAMGAAARYLASGWIHRLFGERLPWGTLVVNVVGCFLLGYLVVRWERATAPAAYRLLWGVGFLGSFTTYSTFALETGTMMNEGAWAGAGGFIALHIVLGMTAIFLGMAPARLT